MTEPRKDNNNDDYDVYPRSVGEELFLVHLLRSEGGTSERSNDSNGSSSSSSRGEDSLHHDNHHHHPRLVPNPIAISQQRKREHTIGEELWQVHCKRSRGMTLGDDDEEHDVDREHPTVSLTTPTKTVGGGMEHHECHYNLRSKDFGGKRK